jgi:hypothetical protein
VMSYVRHRKAKSENRKPKTENRKPKTENRDPDRRTPKFFFLNRVEGGPKRREK